MAQLNSLKLNTTGSGVVSDIWPDATDTRNLGTSDAEWANIYTNQINNVEIDGTSFRNQIEEGKTSADPYSFLGDSYGSFVQCKTKGNTEENKYELFSKTKNFQINDGAGLLEINQPETVKTSTTENNVKIATSYYKNGIRIFTKAYTSDSKNYLILGNDGVCDSSGNLLGQAFLKAVSNNTELPIIGIPPITNKTWGSYKDSDDTEHKMPYFYGMAQRAVCDEDGNNIKDTYVNGESDSLKNYLPIAGGTMTGSITFSGVPEINGGIIYNGPNDQASEVGGTLNNLVIGSWCGVSFTSTCEDGGGYYGTNAVSIDCREGILKANKVYGAVWNDYAEYRNSHFKEPGYVLYELGDDTLDKTNTRLQHFAGISSDTFGFSQGKTEIADTPIAVSGRVLVYTYQDRNNYHPGDCVCAAPDGTVDIMTREEIINYPDRIVGIVSCVPDYDTWGGSNGKSIQVNGRIWIKVK